MRAPVPSRNAVRVGLITFSPRSQHSGHQETPARTALITHSISHPYLPHHPTTPPPEVQYMIYESRKIASIFYLSIQRWFGDGPILESHVVVSSYAFFGRGNGEVGVVGSETGGEGEEKAGGVRRPSLDIRENKKLTGVVPLHILRGGIVKHEEELDQLVEVTFGIAELDVQDLDERRHPGAYVTVRRVGGCPGPQPLQILQ